MLQSYVFCCICSFRYESTITGQFNGHTHKDEYQVFYDLHNKTRAVGMTYVGGSVTPFSHTNFGFRIYTMDGNYTGSSWVCSLYLLVCVCVCSFVYVVYNYTA